MFSAIVYPTNEPTIKPTDEITKTAINLSFNGFLGINTVDAKYPAIVNPITPEKTIGM